MTTLQTTIHMGASTYTVSMLNLDKEKKQIIDAAFEDLTHSDRVTIGRVARTVAGLHGIVSRDELEARTKTTRRRPRKSASGSATDQEGRREKAAPKKKGKGGKRCRTYQPMKDAA